MRKIISSFLVFIIALSSFLCTSPQAFAISHEDYPYSQPAGYYYADDYNFYQCECTSYVAWCLNNRNGISFHNLYKPGSDERLPNSIYSYYPNGTMYSGRWGNANNWKNAAEQLGYRVDSTPAPGAICWTWNGSYSSTGHVAWVSEVREGGNKVVIEQYNAGWVKIDGEYHGNHQFSAEEFTVGSKGEQYIHIKDIVQNGTLDVNGWLDENSNAGSVSGYGTFDVYINGNLAEDDVNDYYNTALPAGTSYTITDIKPSTGHVFCGAVNDSYSGTVSAGNTSEVRLRFKTCTNLGNDFYAFVIWSSQNKFLENGKNRSAINSAASEYAYSYEPIHIWRFIRQTDGEYAGSYKIVSAYDENVLDAKNFGTADGTELVVRASNDSSAERWYLAPDSINGMNYTIGTAYGRLAIDAMGPDGRVHLWTADYDNGNQVFAIYKLDDLGINYVKPAAPSITSYKVDKHDPDHVRIEWSSSPESTFDKRAYTVSMMDPDTLAWEVLLDKTQQTSMTIALTPGQHAFKIEAINTKYADLSGSTTRLITVQSGNTITYDANGGENPPQEQFKLADETITLSTEIPTRRGYTFLGWATSASATTVQYQPGASYSADADLTLYALWRITNPPTLTGKSINMLVGDTRDLADLVEFRHDGVLDYTLTATAGGVVSVNGQRVTATMPGSGALIVSVVEYPAATCTVNIRVVDLNSSMLRLPSALREIGEEAFSDCGLAAVTIPIGCGTIGTRAFADNAELVYIFVPASVTQIANDAFDNCPNLTIYCYPGSAASSLAQARDIRCTLITDDWVLADNVPLGAEITDQKWTYSSREYTESSSASYPGWTLYDSNKTWTDWSEWQNSEIIASSDREVRKQTIVTGYNMISYCVSGPQGRSYQPSPTYSVRLQHGPYWWSKAELDSAHVFPAGSYFDYASNVAGYVLDGTGYCKWDGSDTGGYVPMFIQETINATQWRYRDAVYTYSYYRDVDGESASDPSGQDHVSNVQKWVKYRF